jgi:hypothetical protein
MAEGKLSLRDARILLGVTETATPAQVAATFRQKVRTVHPDVSRAHGAPARFASLVAAYRLVLQAARAEGDARADPKAHEGAPVIVEPVERTRHDVIAGAGGSTIWEAGRPVLWVGPVRTG